MGVVAVLASLASAGCLELVPGLSVGDDPVDVGTPEPVPAESPGDGNDTKPFEPPFELVPPFVIVIGPEGGALRETEPGVRLSFSIRFPSSARVDESKLATVAWELGDGNVVAGRSVKHAYVDPGWQVVRVLVEDVYGRRVEATTGVDVQERGAVQGVVRVGTGGNDGRPEDGTLPHDHSDHVLRVREGATNLRVTLSYADPNGVNNLFLRLYDASGRLVAAADGKSQPKAVALQAPAAGAWTLRVSGDQGVDVTYKVEAVTSFRPSTG